MSYKIWMGLSAIAVLLFLVHNTTNSKTISFKSENTMLDSALINDGPYLFINGDQIIDKRIVNSVVVEQTYPADSSQLYFEPEENIYTTTSKIAALSDVHGQYDLWVELLKANGIVDQELNWSFGDGHFVIVGDVMDRGPKVTEALWLIYKLEIQAEDAGGKLHYLMGNHEYMALRGDLRYIHEKYEQSAELLGTTYDGLFHQETVLGRWLRSKSTIIKINDMILTHGGISEIFLEGIMDFEQMNHAYRATFELDRETVKASPVYAKYHNRDCPIWYRGYFGEEAIAESEVDRILENLNAQHIIVGHTTQTEVTKMYNGKIYCVDSGLKNGEYGEILFIDGG